MEILDRYCTRIYFIILILTISLNESFCFTSVIIDGDSSKIQIKKGKDKFNIKQLSVPAGLIFSGILMNSNRTESIKNEIVEERNEHIPNFKTHVDDYLQFSPIAISYGLDAFGIKSKTDFTNRTVILIKGELVMLGTVYILKNSIHQLRPDISNYHSFPSGHTAQAFAAATFLSEEYKYKFKLMPYLSYGIAGSVGALRMFNNKHFISDVLVGAGIGYLSMKASYWTHQYKWGRRDPIMKEF